MKKLSFTIILTLLAGLMLSGCVFDLAGSEITYKNNYGENTAGYGFHSMDQVKSSLLYIVNKEYGDFKIGGYDSEFDQWLSEQKFTYSATEYVAASTYAEIGYKIVATPSKYFHETSSTDYSLYTVKKGYYTGGLAIYIWDENEGRYSDGNTFDFGCDVK